MNDATRSLGIHKHVFKSTIISDRHKAIRAMVEKLWPHAMHKDCTRSPSLP